MIRQISAITFIFALVVAAFGSLALAQKTASTSRQSDPGTSVQSHLDARPWPHDYTVDGTYSVLYRPQLNSWTGDKLQGRAAMSVKTGETKDNDGKTIDQKTYGVVWISARTETDKEAREVSLNDITIDRVSFPGAQDKEKQYLALVRKVAPATAQVISLNQLESALALSQAGAQSASMHVNNAPPEIAFSFAPAALVSIDGEPQWRAVGGGVERAINTQATLFKYQNGFWLAHDGRWATATALSAEWSEAKPPSAIETARKAMPAKKAPQDPAASANAASASPSGRMPQVYVRTHPAELIVVEGEPRFESLPGTKLSYISNTPADVFVDAANNQAWYALISGRWFNAASSKGPWNYIASTALPKDFTKIASDGPKGAVLASVAGTPEARESLVANSIPQTATVDRTKATFAARYDGEAQFKSIEGTSLSYVWNSATPIIRVSPASYYALSNGVWFTAGAVQGPWTVATSVPAAIYAIPPSSPLHYVTYAYVYRASGDQVYVGYTPGYYGTVVSDGVVVYGTGYSCTSWVSIDWYGCPATYGYGAAFGFGAATGWALAFGWGWNDPWYDPYWGPWAGYYPYPYVAGAAVAGNVYGRWGNSVVGGTAAAWADPLSGNYGRGFRGGYYNTNTGGRGAGYVGRNTNVYTGRSTAAAGGIRYNPETGRVVSGRGGAASNIYTGEGVAAGTRTVATPKSGRVTQEGGIATRSAAGATAAGAATTRGPRGDAAGAGYVHYDRATGDISHGGVADVNGNIYAGRDGNVYRRNDNGGWEKAGGDGNFANVVRPDPSLDQDRFARDRGFQRDQAAGRGLEPIGAQRPNFDRGSFGSSYQGRMGGMRAGGFQGGGFHGGGMRGGGMRRR